jgi:hypothetical protein
LQQVRIFGQTHSNRLQRDKAIDKRVPGAVNDTSGSTSKLTEN